MSVHSVYLHYLHRYLYRYLYRHLSVKLPEVPRKRRQHLETCNMTRTDTYLPR